MIATERTRTICVNRSARVHMVVTRPAPSISVVDNQVDQIIENTSPSQMTPPTPA
ncbi:MAG: hypothetical protein V9E94_15925 [Microthrixaceae bacterium]